ncbi:hypothetical protein [Pandoraea sp. PE-S2R-1]|uniref:hypothetical protein n=1 Tax=Pandoraea sp. PE-S2R-1 TaxID=1986994 RepID=UPI000B3FB9A7|nr:hypothetical protein [Pandoraea sp. PE-S2R-1]
MNLSIRYCVATALLCGLLTGCEDSEIGAVKAAGYPGDQTHTYGSALSDRAACKSTSWKTFKDASNRSAVEYRCELNDAVAALNKVRDAQIDDINGYLKASNDNLSKAIEGTAGDVDRYAKLLEEKKAVVQQIDEKSQAQLAGMDGPSALKAKQVLDTSRAYAVSEVERYQAELDKAKAGGNADSLKASMQSYQDRAAADIANLHAKYDGVKSVTEVIQWAVNDKVVVPTYFGFEIDSSNGKQSVDKASQFTGFLRQIVANRGQDYVTLVAPTVLAGVANTTGK